MTSDWPRSARTISSAAPATNTDTARKVQTETSRVASGNNGQLVPHTSVRIDQQHQRAARNGLGHRAPADAPPCAACAGSRTHKRRGLKAQRPLVADAALELIGRLAPRRALKSEPIEQAQRRVVERIDFGGELLHTELVDQPLDHAVAALGGKAARPSVRREHLVGDPGPGLGGDGGLHAAAALAISCVAHHPVQPQLVAHRRTPRAQQSKALAQAVQRLRRILRHVVYSRGSAKRRQQLVGVRLGQRLQFQARRVQHRLERRLEAPRPARPAGSAARACVTTPAHARARR